MDDLRRGFGRGIVEALAAAGMRVVAVARDPGALAALAREVKGRVETVTGDATDPVTAARVIDRERPRVLVLNAGATGPHRPTRLQTWETFSVFWQTDVRSAFLWVREALALPLERGSTIFIGSSTAAWSSQPLIAGYAAAKAALWEFARCVAPEAASLGLRVARDGHGTAAFARWMRVGEADIARQMGLEPPLTPALVGATVVRILTDASCAGEVGFRVTADGVQPMSEVG